MVMGILSLLLTSVLGFSEGGLGVEGEDQTPSICEAVQAELEARNFRRIRIYGECSSIISNETENVQSAQFCVGSFKKRRFTNRKFNFYLGNVTTISEDSVFRARTIDDRYEQNSVTPRERRTRSKIKWTGRTYLEDFDLSAFLVTEHETFFHRQDETLTIQQKLGLNFDLNSDNPREGDIEWYEEELNLVLNCQ